MAHEDATYCDHVLEKAGVSLGHRVGRLSGRCAAGLPDTAPAAAADRDAGVEECDVPFPQMSHLTNGTCKLVEHFNLN